MRESLKKLIKEKLSGDTAHAGVLLQKGMDVFGQTDSEKSKEKEYLIEKITACQPSAHYRLALLRWIDLTQGADFAAFRATLNGRLVSHLQSGSTLESGAAIAHSYGMPIIAGTALKGVAAAYAGQMGVAKDVCQVLFGEQDNAGHLLWHDAWWLPEGANPFVRDIVTVHHPEYYAGKADRADGMESPVPNLQLAVSGSFYFVISGAADDWRKYARALLIAALAEQGIGAKTAVGYGYFSQNPEDQEGEKVLEKYCGEMIQEIEAEQKREEERRVKAEEQRRIKEEKERIKQERKEAATAIEQAEEGEETWRLVIQKYIKEDKLAEMLGKNYNKLLEECGIDKEDKEGIEQFHAIAREEYPDYTEWKGLDKKSNPGKAYRKIKKEDE